MNILLLPFIAYNDAGIKTGDTYVGLYNLNLMDIKTIEPDEDGHSVVYHNNGSSVAFDVPFIDFCKQINESNLLNLYFRKDVEKIAPKFIDAIKLVDKRQD